MKSPEKNNANRPFDMVQLLWKLRHKTLGNCFWFWTAFSIHQTGLGYTINDLRFGHNSLKSYDFSDTPLAVVSRACNFQPLPQMAQIQMFLQKSTQKFHRAHH
jgi:hypothetical protein